MTDAQEQLHSPQNPFSSLAEKWWDERGPFRFLHRMTPSRVRYLREALARYSVADDTRRLPFKGLRVLDVGCGGGLLSEPMARLGARVTGIDESKESLEVAKRHALSAGLKIRYIAQSMQDYAQQHKREEQSEGAYDIVCALEIIEHVEEPRQFLCDMAEVLKPGGVFVISTLNRTGESWIKGIVLAEYILGMIPRGTHSWRKFVRPDELEEMGRSGGLVVEDVCGLRLRLLRGEFYLDRSQVSLNYIASGRKGVEA